MRPGLRVVGVLLAATVLASCESDTLAAVDDEPDVRSIRLVVGGQQITVTDLGVSGGPAIARVGANTTLTASFHDVNGVTDPRVTPAAFQLNVEVLNSNAVVFQRSTTNPFAGTLTATSVVQGVQLRVSLYHIEPQHVDFGPHNVALVVSN